ncbi:MAG: orotate phosphoribosyltransferase [Chthoniobacterales bacterium]|nr:orotate phosphoribosyltransferase [Chthoniobacterales bacterium]MCX7712827.1 orotate phosphoribosyltransferase [Chthoniobacterales bacterium]
MSKMQPQEILQLFHKTGALLEGHFILRSGLHSRQFFQCALLLQYPNIAQKICSALAQLVSHLPADAVISPALGGILVGHEIARTLNLRHIFVEKNDAGQLSLRRGFKIKSGERFLVAEDVVTRGGRLSETIAILRQHGAIPVAALAIVNRSDENLPDFGCPFFSLLQLHIPTYPPDQLPPDLAAIPPIRPGSK